MCVIIYKPEKEKLSSSVIRRAWSVNSDGAGYVYKRKDGSYSFRKGIMSVGQLIGELKKLQHTELVVHFRYATHGAVNKLMTHPFTCVNSDDAMKGTVGATPMLMHNGTLNQFGNKIESDTCQFAKDVLSRLEIADIYKLLDSVQGKFALITADYGIELFGNFEKYNGLLVSNTYSVARKISITKTVAEIADSYEYSDTPNARNWGYTLDNDDDSWDH